MSQESRAVFNPVPMRDANNNTLYFRTPPVQAYRGREITPPSQQNKTSKIHIGNMAGMKGMKITDTAKGERETRRPH